MGFQSLSTGSMARKSKTYPMRIDPKLWEAAKEAASAERRSVAALIEEILTEDLVRRGFFKIERPVKKRGRKQ